jgi:hypothetical protein
MNIQTFYDIENKVNREIMPEHNLDFIKDQLINAWEVTPLDEMKPWIIVNMNLELGYLYKDIVEFIDQWYLDDKRRNQCLMDMINTDYLIETWLTEFVPQEFIFTNI